MAVTASDVHRARFGMSLLGSRGYREEEVDDFLDRVAAALEGEDDLTADEVRAASFDKPPLGRRGYDRHDVDTFLQRAATALTHRHHGGIPAPRASPENGP